MSRSICQDDHGPDQTIFPHSQATLIPKPARPQTSAARIVDYVKQGFGDFSFVAEDGSAIAAWVGTVTKIDVRSGATLSADEHYRLEVRGETRTAFNVSQETYVRKSYRDSDAVVSLMPLVMLDRYRMLCVNGAPSIWASQNPKHPTKTLFLALIDDRQRGPHPNLVRAIKVPGEVGQFMAIGTQSGKYLIRALVKNKVRYLAVDPDTLGYRWVKAPDRQEPPVDVRALQKQRPGLTFLTSARWSSSFYFQTHIREAPYRIGYVWDGTDLRSTGSFYMVAASVNGAYAWVADKQAGNQWLLQR